MTMLHAVRKNFEAFTERQVKDAILARETQAMTAYPTGEEFKLMVSNKSLKGIKVCLEDNTNTRTMFGPNRVGLRGGE